MRAFPPLCSCSICSDTFLSILQSAITLYAPPTSLSSDISQSDFSVSAITANAPISIAVNHRDDSAPTNLALQAESSFAPVVVSLDPNFEGKFHLESGMGTEVFYSTNVVDPSGRGRLRMVDVEDRRLSEASGRVSWVPSDPKPRPKGLVSLRTRSAKAVLYLEEKCFMSSCLEGNRLPLI